MSTVLPDAEARGVGVSMAAAPAPKQLCTMLLALAKSMGHVAAQES